MIEAVFLDFDGVIVESADIKTAAFRALYCEHGAAVVDRAIAHHRANGGISRRKKIRHCHRTLLGIELADDALDRLCRRFSALVEDAVVEAPLVPGAADFLTVHHRRLPLYVVSGTPEDELLRIVARRDLGRFFAGVHGSPREKPPIINGILAALALAPERTLFIGDARTDHDAAAVCGVPFIGRVAAGEPDPFPRQTRVVRDLDGLMLE